MKHETKLTDGATTRVSATSFRLSGKDIQDYKINDTLTLKKVGFIPDENITKWQVINLSRNKCSKTHNCTIDSLP